jgi:Right handed beta helix region
MRDTPPCGLGPTSPSVHSSLTILVGVCTFFVLASGQPAWGRLAGMSRSLVPATSLGSACRGVQVPAEAELPAIMASHGPRTTYCLATARYTVNTTISVDPGDRVIGAGRDATHIDGGDLPQTAEGIFAIGGRSLFQGFDVFGAPTPTEGSGVFCSPKSNCGKAFAVGGKGPLILRSIDCHDNGGSCVGGGGAAAVDIDGLDCWNNGSAYSMTKGFTFAACVKRAAIYESGGDTTITNSYIHDNPWVGVWCDVCKYGVFDIEGSRIERNGANGVQWELSGGWTSEDRAIIRNNVIIDNNRGEEASFRGGVGISTANDVTVEGNRFGGNAVAGINIIFTLSRDPPQPDPRGVEIRDNSMNGDPIVGCGAPSIVSRVFVDRGRIIGGLSIALAIMLVLGVALRGRRGMLIALCAALASLFALLIVVVLSHEPSVAICVNNL